MYRSARVPKGLRPKQVTIIRPRCPITGRLIKPGEGDIVVVEDLDKNRRTSMRVFAEEVLAQYHWCWAHNVQIVQ